MPVFSDSRLSTFEQCPLKYKYQYIDKFKVKAAKTVEAFMGSCVHEALEKLYRDLKLQKNNSLEELRQETLEAVKNVVSAKEFPANESNLCTGANINACARNGRTCLRWKLCLRGNSRRKMVFVLMNELTDLSARKKELEEKIEAVKQDLIEYMKKLGVEVVFGSEKKAKISTTRDIAFPAKHSAERDELIRLLKRGGFWGNAEDLDIFALKKIVQNRESGKDVLSKLELYQEESTSAAVRLMNWTRINKSALVNNQDRYNHFPVNCRKESPFPLRAGRFQ